MKQIRIFLSVVLVLVGMTVFAQSREGLSTYQLSNGLTVYLWEDHDQPDVNGYVAVRAGSIDEPAEYTGLAHYLEHMLFKGTDKIGAVDWEKEKPLYEDIIRMYDEYADATDPVVREELITKINEASREAAKYSTTEDFFNLLNGIGAEGVNAFTSYDMTCYLSHFPSYQMERWLTIFSDRMMNPVFRTFQAELENVFEEYNMYEDAVSSHISRKFYEESYGGHPYERDVIGLPEHLKNPRLSRLIEFYNTWYVPNNMALILVGDFETETVKPLIEKTFSRLQPKELPARKQYPEKSFEGNPKKSFKIGYYPQFIWTYKGVNAKSEDLIPLEVCISLLSNNSSTGLLDKLSMDGDVSMASASLDARRDMGRISIFAIPYYDVNQRRYESLSATEKIIFREVDKLKNGNIEDWQLAMVKEEAVLTNKLAFENANSKMNSLVSCFIYERPIDDIFTELERIKAITKEDIQRVAKKYLDADHLTLSFDEGTPKKNKLAKPKIEPLDPVKGVETEYSKMFKQIPEGEVKISYVDMNDVTVKQLYDNVRLHYTKNPKNDVFTLTLRYGVGTEKMPMLEYAVDMMNVAGMQPADDAQSFRKRLAELGGRCTYSVSESYLTISIIGEDKNLEDICRLVNLQILMPKHDDKQFQNIKGNELRARMTMSKADEAQAPALLDYVMYGNKSEYIDMLPFKEVYDMDLIKVNTTFLNATKYALDAHYVGNRPIEEVEKALPLQANVLKTESPFVREKKDYAKSQIFFLPNSNLQQAKVYFYFKGTPYSIEDAVLFQAFNQYFSGGFSGLVLDEIRTKRSMAYSTMGNMIPGELPGKDSHFLGYIGTQSDKVADAVDVFMDLVKNMPENPDQLEPIKAALRQSNMTNKPSFRRKSQTYDRWREMGYTDDPARTRMAAIDNLKFEDIVKFYKENIQNKPVSILIVGDPKLINTKQIEQKYGKITKVSKGKIFAPVNF